MKNYFIYYFKILTTKIKKYTKNVLNKVFLYGILNMYSLIKRKNKYQKEIIMETKIYKSSIVLHTSSTLNHIDGISNVLKIVRNVKLNI